MVNEQTLLSVHYQTAQQEISMATINQLTRIPLERMVKHTEVDASYSILQGEDGHLMLQIDTYGSQQRQILNKKSQSLRLTHSALVQLKTILAEEFNIQ